MNEPADPAVDELSRQIADEGREALVARLRSAYADAAAAHADIVSLTDARIEELVQNAADHADGLQWRRALATVASRRLGVSVVEALSHPAVSRAQALLGAPSYEQSLAELIAQPVPPAQAEPPAAVPVETEDPEPPAQVEPDDAPEIAGQMQLDEEGEAGVAVEPEATMPMTLEHERAEVPVSDDSLPEELEEVEADDTAVALLPEPEPAFEDDAEAEAEAEAEATAPEPEAEAGASAEPADEADVGAAAETEQDAETAESEQATTQPDSGDGPLEDLRVPIIHLGGVASLPTHEPGMDIRLSAEGLDIMHSTGEIIGRLMWDEIYMIDVPNQRKRRRHPDRDPRLIVRTNQGDATFEVPGYVADELRDRVALRFERYQPRP